MLAVGVSGGADSMSLCLWAEDWARSRGGRSVALIVDHGLRAGSSAEAARVSAWLEEFQIENQVLTWRHESLPLTGLQEKARFARRELLASWCAAHGVLHLLLGHHRRDQAETILMRRKRSPTGDGVSGMSMVTEGPTVRILRPLLDVSPDQLRVALTSADVPWIEDPTNEDYRFERVRIRNALPRDLGAVIQSGLEAGQMRAVADDATAKMIAGVFSYCPGGHVWGDFSRLSDHRTDEVARALGRLVRTVGGRAYLPRGDRLRSLAERLLQPGFKGATLGGCRFLNRRGRLLIAREASLVAPEEPIAAGETVVWDGRFTVRLKPKAPPGLYTVGALGSTGWRQIRDLPSVARATEWPAAARNVLPALRLGGTVIEVPHLTYTMTERHSEGVGLLEFEPSTPEPIVGGRFFIASVLD